MLFHKRHINRMSMSQADEASEKLTELKRKCVGILYPSIIDNEINDIKKRREKLFKLAKFDTIEND